MLSERNELSLSAANAGNSSDMEDKSPAIRSSIPLIHLWLGRYLKLS